MSDFHKHLGTGKSTTHKNFFEVCNTLRNARDQGFINQSSALDDFFLTLDKIDGKIRAESYSEFAPRFIVIEGLDGSGKSSLSKSLTESQDLAEISLKHPLSTPPREILLKKIIQYKSYLC